MLLLGTMPKGENHTDVEKSYSDSAQRYGKAEVELSDFLAVIIQLPTLLRLAGTG